MFGAEIGRIVKTYDYINHVVITLPLSVYEGTWTTLFLLVAMHHHDRSCVSVGNFLKLLRSPTLSSFPPLLLQLGKRGVLLPVGIGLPLGAP